MLEFLLQLIVTMAVSIWVLGIPAIIIFSIWFLGRVWNEGK